MSSGGRSVGMVDSAALMFKIHLKWTQNKPLVLIHNLMALSGTKADFNAAIKHNRNKLEFIQTKTVNSIFYDVNVKVNRICGTR